MAQRDGAASRLVTVTWPGKPVGSRSPTLPVTGFQATERWPAAPGPGASTSARATVVAGDARAVLDAWSHGAVAPPPTPVRLIYLDPPFATGTTFAADLPIGERRAGQPTLRLPAYRDTWEGGLPGYLTAMYELLVALRDVLADDGWLCLHCDHRTSAYFRLILDELFGVEAFRNEIVWSYGLGNGSSRRGFPRKHDTLLLYAKSEAATFTPIRGAVSAAMANKYRHRRADGTRFMRSYGREYDLKGGKPFGSVWEIPSIAPTSAERTGYPTQKPLALLERLILATTAPGDTVLDPCCGSGTTLLAAAKLGRSAVGLDSSPLAIAASRARLAQHGVGFDLLSPVDPTEGAHRHSPDRPTGDLTAAPARRYGLSARAESSPAPPGSAGRHLTVSLTGLSVTAPQLVTPGGQWAVLDDHLADARIPSIPLTDQWTDWIEGWAVQSTDAGEEQDVPFTVAASSVRTGRQRSLETRLIVPQTAEVDPSSITVRLFDLFGASSDHVVPVTSPGD
jgi:DNA modification methylase